MDLGGRFMFTGAGRQLTIFVGESDQYHHRPLYMAIIERLRREGCGGATVTRGLAGFGASSLIHTASIVRLSIDLPIVITVVDRPVRIERVLGAVREMAPHALIVAQDVEIVQSGVPFKEGLPGIAVSEVMRRDVVTVRPDTLVKELVELLIGQDFTAVPVIDEGHRVIGMISDHDLLTRGGTRVGIDLQRATDPAFVRELHEALQGSTRRVEELMTREIVTITPETLLGAAARLMVDRNLKRLPVVDADGRLTGILGRLDVLNTLAAVHLPEWHPAAARSGGATVADVMDATVATVTASTPIEEIFEQLVASAHKRVVVIDPSRRVIGIIADGDLLSRVGREHWPGLVELLASKAPVERLRGPARQQVQKLRGKTARDVMAANVVSVREEMPIASALALSAERHAKRMPVVDADGVLIGIVGRTALLRALLKSE
jgi:CBS domain-containing protein